MIYKTLKAHKLLKIKNDKANKSSLKQKLHLLK